MELAQPLLARSLAEAAAPRTQWRRRLAAGVEVEAADEGRWRLRSERRRWCMFVFMWGEPRARGVNEREEKVAAWWEVEGRHSRDREVLAWRGWVANSRVRTLRPRRPLGEHSVVGCEKDPGKRQSVQAEIRQTDTESSESSESGESGESGESSESGLVGQTRRHHKSVAAATRNLRHSLRTTNIHAPSTTRARAAAGCLVAWLLCWVLLSCSCRCRHTPLGFVESQTELCCVVRCCCCCCCLVLVARALFARAV